GGLRREQQRRGLLHGRVRASQAVVGEALEPADRRDGAAEFLRSQRLLGRLRGKRAAALLLAQERLDLGVGDDLVLARRFLVVDEIATHARRQGWAALPQQDRHRIPAETRAPARWETARGGGRRRGRQAVHLT